MGRQDLGCLGEQRGLFVLEMLVDVVPQRLECGRKHRIVVDLLQVSMRFLNC